MCAARVAHPCFSNPPRFGGFEIWASGGAAKKVGKLSFFVLDLGLRAWETETHFCRAKLFLGQWGHYISIYLGAKRPEKKQYTLY